MSSINLLNINVDALFEQHSIGEIDQIQKKLQMEVEMKREELRTMVGERYRDLLKAADTIAIMKDTSSNVIGQVDNILINLKNLNEKQLMGFKIVPQNTATIRATTSKLNNYYSTVVQIKLLTDMPELIWTNIDDEKFSIAAELFLFSRHISTGLHLDSSNKFLEHLPVARKQWEIIKPFFYTIKESCLATLKRESLTAESATDCLLSLFLLEKTTLDQLFKMFIDVRNNAFLSTLTSDRNEQRRVKDRILISLVILNSTVELIYKCFFENGKGLLIEALEKLANPTKSPTIALMNLNDQIQLHVLPDLVSKFKPTFNIPTLSSDSIKSTIDNWLQTISHIAKKELQELFNRVSSMKIIQEIRKNSQNIKKHSNWLEMCECLSLPKQLDFYENQYKSLLNDRIRDIIRQSWIKSVDVVYNEIQEILCIYHKQQQQQQQCEENELNFWIENINDIPPSLKYVLNQDKKTNSLLMKIKGFNTDIVRICSLFDKRLEIIFSEVCIYLEDDDYDDANGRKLVEKQILVEYLKDVSYEQISELITKIKSLQFNNNCKEFVLLGRLFVSFTELCPNFKLCLSYTYTSSSWEKISSDKKSLEKWIKVCNLLEDEAFEFWKKFCDILLKDIPVDGICRMNSGYEMILKDFVNWETLTVEEKDEQDNTIQSIIRIPSQPRISLQIYLVNIIESLNKWVPQTLPKKVLLYLDMKLIEKLLNQFKILINEEKFISSNQNIALQLYFDLKFLQLMFVARDDKKSLDEFQKLTSNLKNFVDPFDYELFYSYMNNNVKKCAQRMQHEFGVLLPYPENIGMLTDMKQIIGVLDKDPNVLNLTSNGSISTWFPLLPIIASDNKSISLIGSGGHGQQDTDKISTTATTTTLKSSKKSESKLSASQQIAQNYASNVKSGAAAFFGAMSQDWFR